MYRPWNEDARPAWRVTGTWGTPQGFHDDDVQLLLKTLHATGLTRGAAVDRVGCGRLTLSLAVKALHAETAVYAAHRILEVACNAAGLGPLGMNLQILVEAHPSVTPPGR